MRTGRKKRSRKGKAGYLHTVRLVRDTLHPVDPPPRLVIEIRNLGQAFGTDGMVLKLAEDSRKKRRSLIIGGVCSTLSIGGMAAYALARHYLRHGTIDAVEAIEADGGLMTPA